MERVTALSMYFKQKGLNKNLRRQTSDRFSIPGYNDEAKTVARKPSKLNLPQNIQQEPPSNSIEDSRSSLLNDSSISDFIDSATHLYE